MLSYVANELLVNRLANKCATPWRPHHLSPLHCSRRSADAPCSRTFQQFAIRSDAVLRDLSKVSAEKQKELAARGAELAKKSLAEAQELMDRATRELKQGK